MVRWQKTFERLDGISRTRALTDNESAMLEHAMRQCDYADAAHAKQKTRWTETETNALCDIIADGGTFKAASHELGRSKNSCISRFHHVSREIGWQAA